MSRAESVIEGTAEREEHIRHELTRLQQELDGVKGNAQPLATDPAIGYIRSFEHLLQLTERQLSQEPRPDGYSTEDLIPFQHTIYTELKRAWHDIGRRKYNAIISDAMNREIDRRLPWTLCEIAVLLYRRVRASLNRARSKAVFSDDANSIRFLAKLAGDARRAFKIKEISDYLAEQLKHSKNKPCRPVIVTQASKDLQGESVTGHVPVYMLIRWYIIQDMRDDKYQQQLSDRIASLRREMKIPKIPFDTTMQHIKELESFLEDSSNPALSTDVSSSPSTLSVRQMAALGLPFQNRHLIQHDEAGFKTVGRLSTRPGKVLGLNSSRQSLLDSNTNISNVPGTTMDPDSGLLTTEAGPPQRRSSAGLGDVSLIEPSTRPRRHSLPSSLSSESSPELLDHIQQYRMDMKNGNLGLGRRAISASHLPSFVCASDHSDKLPREKSMSVVTTHGSVMSNAPKPPALSGKMRLIARDAPGSTGLQQASQQHLVEGEDALKSAHLRDVRKDTTNIRKQHAQEVKEMQAAMLKWRQKPDADIGDMDPILSAHLNTRHLVDPVLPKRPPPTKEQLRNTTTSTRYLLSHVIPRHKDVDRFVSEAPLSKEDNDELDYKCRVPRVDDRDLVWFVTLDPALPVFLEHDPAMSSTAISEMDDPLFRLVSMTKIYADLVSEYRLETIVDDTLSELHTYGIFGQVTAAPTDARIMDALMPHVAENDFPFSVNDTLLCNDESLCGWNPMDGTNNDDAGTPAPAHRQSVARKNGRTGNSTSSGDADDAVRVEKRFHRSYRNRPEKVVANPSEQHLAKQARQYESWLKWWQNTLEFGDYKEWLCEQEADFLPAAFAMFPDRAPPDLLEDEAELQARREAMQLHRDRSEQMLKEKKSYIKGQWNVNSVQMGGLAADVQDLALDELLGETMEARRQQEFDALQQRFNQVWKDLRLSTMEKLNKAIMYSSAKYSRPSTTAKSQKSVKLTTLDVAERLRTAKSASRHLEPLDVQGHTLHALQQAVGIWEAVAVAILQRERILEELEAFERVASDPTRLYARASESSRVSEAKQRANIMAKLDKATKKVEAQLAKVETILNDLVTFDQRPYRDKMASDVREMLYWLTQERRQRSIVQAPLRLTATTLRPSSKSESLAGL
eukprot:m.229380 g.229380  ORF g.229380 m.229380 type:complete len:1135 (-) comp17052_c0_seq2:1555-4959(-)